MNVQNCVPHLLYNISTLMTNVPLCLAYPPTLPAVVPDMPFVSCVLCVLYVPYIVCVPYIPYVPCVFCVPSCFTYLRALRPSLAIRSLRALLGFNFMVRGLAHTE